MYMNICYALKYYDELRGHLCNADKFLVTDWLTGLHVHVQYRANLRPMSVANGLTRFFVIYQT